MEYIRHLTESGEWAYSNVKSVGQLELLTTEDKTDVVSAINEINRYFATLNLDQDALKAITEGVEDINSMLDYFDGLLNVEREKIQALATSLDLKDEEMRGLIQIAESNLDTKISETKTDIVDLKDKATKLEMDLSLQGQEIDGKLVLIQQDIVNTGLEMSSKLSKSEFDENVGVNKWVATFYPTVMSFDTLYPKISDLSGLVSDYVEEQKDSVTLYPFNEEKQGILHLFTNLYVTQGKTVALNMAHNSGLSVLLNGAYVYYKAGQGSPNVSISLRAGWNTVEILFGINDVVGTLTSSSKLSELVNKMTTTIGVGSKNETRLINNETAIKQTNDAISLKADTTVVEQIGNKVTENTAELEIQAEQIASKVDSVTFNNYTGRLETAETSITQTNEKIESLATKTELDTLNGIVETHETGISQLNDAIELVAKAEDVNKITGRLETAESSIKLNSDKIENMVTKTEFDTAKDRITQTETAITQLDNSISLKADKTEVDTASDKIGKLESQLTVQAGEIATKVGQVDIDKSLEGVTNQYKNLETSVTQTQESITLKADKTDLEGVNDRLKMAESSLTVQSEQISTKVSQLDIREAIDNISVGGRNLVRNSKEQVVTANTNNFSYLTLVSRALEKNATYTLSFEAEFITGSSTVITAYRYYDVGKVMEQIQIPFTEGKRMSVTFSTDDLYNYSLLLYAGKQGSTANNTVKFTNIKLEKGNKATDYTLAPEDIDDRIALTETSITQTASEINAKISDVEGKFTTLSADVDGVKTIVTNIEGQYTTVSTTVEGVKTNVADVEKGLATITTTVEGIETNVSDLEGNYATYQNKLDTFISKIGTPTGSSTLIQTVESLSTKVNGIDYSSEIEQLSNSINAKVSQGDVINQINLSTEGVKIDGSMINIDGNTTFTNTKAKVEDVEETASDAYDLALDAYNIADDVEGMVDNWEYANTTMIDGGNIYTGTITANKLSANAIDGKVITGATLRTSTYASSNGGVVINSTGISGYDTSGTKKFNVGTSGVLNATDAIISGTISAGDNSTFSGSVSTGKDLTVGENIYMTYNYANRFSEKGIYFYNDGGGYASNIVGTYLKIDIVNNNVINLKSSILNLESSSTRVVGTMDINYDGTGYGLSLNYSKAKFAKGANFTGGTVDFTGATVTGLVPVFG